MPGVPGPAPGYAPGPAAPTTPPPPVPQNSKCTSCGAPMNPAQGMAVVVCEYCGAVTTMGAAGAQLFQKHFMLDNRIQNDQALQLGGEWLNKGVLRRKVAERSELGQVTMKYVPYWIIPTSVVADFQGTKGAGVAQMRSESTAGKAAGMALLALKVASAANQANRGRQVNTQPQVIRVRDRIQLQYNLPIVAVRGYAKFQPDDGFQFNIQAKRSFDKRATGGIEVMSGDVSEGEAKKRVDTLESIQVYPTTYDGELLHAPVWFMEYAHKGKPMFILIDGHAGAVMDGERPGFSLF